MSLSPKPEYRINDLFETYAKALEQYDTKLLTHLYLTPCTMISDETTTLFTDATKLEGFFNLGTGFYKQFGITHVHADVRSKHLLTDKIAQVKVNWHYRDSNNTTVYDCNYHYTIKLNKDNQWKIILSVSVDEKEKMEEWKNRKGKK